MICWNCSQPCEGADPSARAANGEPLCSECEQEATR